MNIIRLGVISLAVAGFLAGAILRSPTLLIITVVSICAAALMFAAIKVPRGALIGIGIVILFMGGLVCLLLPMWIVWLVKTALNLCGTVYF